MLYLLFNKPIKHLLNVIEFLHPYKNNLMLSVVEEMISNSIFLFIELSILSIGLLSMLLGMGLFGALFRNSRLLFNRKYKKFKFIRQLNTIWIIFKKSFSIFYFM